MKKITKFDVKEEAWFCEHAQGLRKISNEKPKRDRKQSMFDFRRKPRKRRMVLL